MGYINVEHNGKWACFYSIIDDFITTFTDLKEYDAWRKEEYGRIGYTPLNNPRLKLQGFFEVGGVQ